MRDGHTSTAAPHPFLQVGLRVIARVQTGVCDVGELGLVYEIDDRGPGGGQGYSVIFSSRRYEGFSPDELATMISTTGDPEPSMVGYPFPTCSPSVERRPRTRPGSLACVISPAPIPLLGSLVGRAPGALSAHASRSRLMVVAL